MARRTQQTGADERSRPGGQVAGGSSGVLDETQQREFTNALLEWYHPARRPFPWRDSSDCYYVTVCEVLLQQTTAEQVAKVTSELFRRFPLPLDLAESDEMELAVILRPLGLRRRVRQVREIARAFARARTEGRELSVDELRNLMGVGPYVAAAVRLLALGEPDALIDNPVLRLLGRVFSIHAPVRRHPAKWVVAFARRLVPVGRAREYNLALVDLARLVCRPRNPHCWECPVGTFCDYRRALGGLEPWEAMKP